MEVEVDVSQHVREGCLLFWFGGGHVKGKERRGGVSLLPTWRAILVGEVFG